MSLENVYLWADRIVLVYEIAAFVNVVQWKGVTGYTSEPFLGG